MGKKVQACFWDWSIKVRRILGMLIMFTSLLFGFIADNSSQGIVIVLNYNFLIVLRFIAVGLTLIGLLLTFKD
jgi:hypothetical protein